MLLAALMGSVVTMATVVLTAVVMGAGALVLVVKVAIWEVAMVARVMEAEMVAVMAQDVLVVLQVAARTARGGLAAARVVTGVVERAVPVAVDLVRVGATVAVLAVGEKAAVMAAVMAVVVMVVVTEVVTAAAMVAVETVAAEMGAGMAAAAKAEVDWALVGWAAAAMAEHVVCKV